MSQATGIFGKGALAFADNNYRSVELFVMNRKIRRIFTNSLQLHQQERAEVV
jgi:hypothetical protein